MSNFWLFFCASNGVTYKFHLYVLAKIFAWEIWKFSLEGWRHFWKLNSCRHGVAHKIKWKFVFCDIRSFIQIPNDFMANFKFLGPFWIFWMCKKWENFLTRWIMTVFQRNVVEVEYIQPLMTSLERLFIQFPLSRVHWKRVLRQWVRKFYHFFVREPVAFPNVLSLLILNVENCMICLIFAFFFLCV
jgi:hypothetical protein